MTCFPLTPKSYLGLYPLLMVFFSLLFLLCPSCSSQQHQKALSLVEYVNLNILELAPIEARALERYAAVTGENYTSDEEVHSVLEKEVIPTYERFFRLLRDVPTEDPEIGSLHSLYVRSAGMLLEGFRMKRLALVTGDVRLMESANARIEEGRDQGAAWRARLEELADLYNVREEK